MSGSGFGKLQQIGKWGGLYLVNLESHRDERGEFVEMFNSTQLEEFMGDNVTLRTMMSKSKKDVFRGLHYSMEPGFTKVVTCVHGTVLDIVVDVTIDSPTYGEHHIEELSGDQHKNLIVPPGVAHGFLVTSPEAVVTYVVNGDYRPDLERSINIIDDGLGIDPEKFPIPPVPIRSRKDIEAPKLSDIDLDSVDMPNRDKVLRPGAW